MMNLNEASFADIQAELQRRGVSGVLLVADLNNEWYDCRFGNGFEIIALVDDCHKKVLGRFIHESDDDEDEIHW